MNFTASSKRESPRLRTSGRSCLSIRTGRKDTLFHALARKHGFGDEASLSIGSVRQAPVIGIQGYAILLLECRGLLGVARQPAGRHDEVAQAVEAHFAVVDADRLGDVSVVSDDDVGSCFERSLRDDRLVIGDQCAV